jgi:HK97 family phage major capsid protein
MKTIEELRARQEEIRTSLADLDQEFAGQQMPAGSRSEWESLEEEFRSNTEVLTELEFRRDRVAEIAGGERHQDPGSEMPQIRRAGSVRGEDIYDLSTIRGSASSPEEMGRELRDRALQAVERAHIAHEEADEGVAKSHVETLLERHDDAQGTIARRLLTTGSKLYQRAFAKVVAGEHLSPEESRALSLTGETGGFAVPFALDPTIIPTSNGVVNPIRDLARVEPITGDTWKGVSSAGTTAAYSGEAEETEEAELKLGQPEVSTERASTLILASFEITQDWTGVQGEIARAIQDAKDTLEASKFLTGTGEKEPFGVLTGATTTVLTAEKEKFGPVDVYALKAALPPRFRPRASWLANDSIYDRVRQFDTAGGASLWVQLQDDRPATLIGKPAYELSTMNAEVKENKLNMIYGDFSYYLIAERIGMGIEVIPHVMNGKKATGQRGFYAFWRNGAKALHANAFRVLKGHT